MANLAHFCQGSENEIAPPFRSRSYVWQTAEEHLCLRHPDIKAECRIFYVGVPLSSPIQSSFNPGFVSYQAENVFAKEKTRLESGPRGQDLHSRVYMHVSHQRRSISSQQHLDSNPTDRSCSVIRSPTAPRAEAAPTRRVPHETEVGRDHLLIMKALSQLVWWNVAQ